MALGEDIKSKKLNRLKNRCICKRGEDAGQAAAPETESQPPGTRTHKQTLSGEPLPSLQFMNGCWRLGVGESED